MLLAAITAPALDVRCDRHGELGYVRAHNAELQIDQCGKPQHTSSLDDLQYDGVHRNVTASLRE